MLHEIRRISAAVNEVYIMNTDNRPIGVLDSGLGGISVLRELVKLMPGEAFLYYGDSANALMAHVPRRRSLTSQKRMWIFYWNAGRKP